MAAFSTILALTLAGVGTGLSIYGQKKAGNQAAKAALDNAQAQSDATLAQGAAAQRAADADASIADYNAAVADLQAKDATDRGMLEENRFRRGINTMIGAQRAGTAARNIDVGFGSAVDVQADAAQLGELDALTIRTNAAREAWGYAVEGVNERNKAAVERATGGYASDAAKTVAAAQLRSGKASADAYGSQSTIGAVGSLFTGASSLLLSRYGFNSTARA